jgi:hypothetical protein
MSNGFYKLTESAVVEPRFLASAEAIPGLVTGRFELGNSKLIVENGGEIGGGLQLGLSVTYEFDSSQSGDLTKLAAMLLLPEELSSLGVPVAKVNDLVRAATYEDISQMSVSGGLVGGGKTGITNALIQGDYALSAGIGISPVTQNREYYFQGDITAALETPFVFGEVNGSAKVSVETNKNLQIEALSLETIVEYSGASELFRNLARYTSMTDLAMNNIVKRYEEIELNRLIQDSLFKEIYGFNVNLKITDPVTLSNQLFQDLRNLLATAKPENFATEFGTPFLKEFYRLLAQLKDSVSVEIKSVESQAFPIGGELAGIPTPIGVTLALALDAELQSTTERTIYP